MTNGRARNSIMLAVALAAVVGVVVGFTVARLTQSGPLEEMPMSAPIALVARCDRANGIWLDLEEVQTSPLLGGVPNSARVPGCYRQIGAATNWILDLGYSGDRAQAWARLNGLTQDDLTRGELSRTTGS